MRRTDDGPRPTLWDFVARAGLDDGRTLNASGSAFPLARLRNETTLDLPLERFAGRSVVVAVPSQLAAAAAMIELDGVARRILLCPPDVPRDVIEALAVVAGSDATLLAPGEFWRPLGARAAVEGRADPQSPCPMSASRGGDIETEWVLLTSGTTGLPKLVAHTLASLTDPMIAAPTAPDAVWSTFYDIRRYGGLTILLRALLGGGSMVLSDAAEAPADFLARAGRNGVTHISGTPSHWRRTLMSGEASRMAPRYVRLSGEIADQPILDALKAAYPEAAVAHAFASTEAGVAFDVPDGMAGFPASLLYRTDIPAQMRVEDGSLRIRSRRTAAVYLGADAPPLRDADGYIDTGDMIEIRDGRCLFVGRRGGIINVGGQKVHPEEIEGVINRHPGIRMSLVRARRNPITGAVVAADIVLRDRSADAEAIKREVAETCRAALPPHKVPALLRVVPSLDVAPSGKLLRPAA